MRIIILEFRKYKLKHKNRKLIVKNVLLAQLLCNLGLDKSIIEYRQWLLILA